MRVEDVDRLDMSVMESFHKTLFANAADFTVESLATLKLQGTAHLEQNLINKGTLSGSGTIVVAGRSGVRPPECFDVRAFFSTKDEYKRSIPGRLIGVSRDSHGKPALLYTHVEVQQCFIHCGKAMIRSNLWQPGSWDGSTRSIGALQIANLMGAASEEQITETSARLEQAYVDGLY